MKEIKDKINLLWTSGWDSTFRLLQLVLLEKRKVQPHYLIDSGRKSRDIEIRAMDRMKKALFFRYPFAQEYVLPTIFYNVADVQANSMIKESFKNIRLKKPIGIQYEWLAEYCDQFRIKDAELCIVGHDSGSGVGKLIVPLLENTDKKEHADLKISEKFKSTDEYMLFHFFNFPLIFTTKVDMYNIAKDDGFLDILCKTWFCHKPIFNRFSCGICNPCKDVVKDGLVFRLSFIRRVRHSFYDVESQVRSFLKHKMNFSKQ